MKAENKAPFAILCGMFLIAVALVFALVGCATVSTTVTEQVLNGVTNRTTKTEITTFFEGDAQVAKVVARNGNYTNGQYAATSGAALAATSSNLVTISQDVITALALAVARTATLASTNR